jgi:hypothetical protein
VVPRPHCENNGDEPTNKGPAEENIHYRSLVFQLNQVGRK